MISFAVRHRAALWTLACAIMLGFIYAYRWNELVETDAHNNDPRYNPGALVDFGFAPDPPIDKFKMFFLPTGVTGFVFVALVYIAGLSILFRKGSTSREDQPTANPESVAGRQ